MESRLKLPPISGNETTETCMQNSYVINNQGPVSTQMNDIISHLSTLTILENKRMESMLMNQRYSHQSSDQISLAIERSNYSASPSILSKRTDQVLTELQDLQRIANSVIIKKHGIINLENVSTEHRFNKNDTHFNHVTAALTNKMRQSGSQHAFVNQLRLGTRGNNLINGARANSSNSGSAVGRKSIRVIEQDLNKKIKLLQTNASQWEVFCARVSSYKAATHYGKQVDVIQRNILNTTTYLPQFRQEFLQMKKQEMLEKRKFVQQESKRIFDERQKYMNQLVLNKSGKLHRPPVNTKLNQMQTKWLMIGSLASRIYVIQTLVRTNHVEFLAFKRQSRAARLIQRAWRQHRVVVMHRRKVWALKVITRAMSKFIAHIRLRRKHAAANTIRTFFKEIHDVGKLLKIIKKYRYSVISAQRLVRQKLESRRAQLTLLEYQFDSVYFAMNQGSNSNLTSGPPSTPSKLKNKRSGKKKRDIVSGDKNKKADNLFKIDPTVRYTVLNEDYIKRRRIFVQDLIQYSKEMDKYQLDVNEPPHKRPIFRTLLPMSDMMDLVTKALA